MNKIKIIIISLLIGAISGYALANPFVNPYAGLPFGIAVILCLRIFFKHKTNIGESIGFVFLSTLACFLAVSTYISLFQNKEHYIFGLLVSGFIGSLVLVFSYANILRIKFNLVHKLTLLGLGTLLSLTALNKLFKFTMSSFSEGGGLVDVSEIGVFIFWQSIMLASIMYITATIKENKKLETPLFVRKD